jgi:hypothetical protein
MWHTDIQPAQEVRSDHSPITVYLSTANRKSQKTTSGVQLEAGSGGDVTLLWLHLRDRIVTWTTLFVRKWGQEAGTFGWGNPG